MQDFPANYLMIGGIREDYCITPDGRSISGVLGGNATYASVGARIWSDRIALVSRVGNNFPLDWLTQLAANGISTRGVRILDNELDTRTFYAYRSLEERVDTNPAAHYARWGLPLPKALQGYQSSTAGQESRDRPSPTTVRTGDIPKASLAGIIGAHLSPTDYLTHLMIPGYLHHHGVKTITLDPSIRYMSPDFRKELPTLLHGINAFLPSLQEAAAFIANRGISQWEIADLFHQMGPELVVLKAGANGQYLSDAQRDKRWHIPAYPTQIRDVTGAGDAFCGAFMVGLVETQDALEATLRGNISASFVVEGTGALYALDAPAHLRDARREALKNMVREE